MTRLRRALAFSGASFLIAALWTAFVVATEIGVRIYLLPGAPIAKWLHPCETPQPFVPKQAATPDEAFGELVVDIMVRCSLPQGIIALELALVFWLVIVPLAVFAGVWFHRKSHAQT